MQSSRAPRRAWLGGTSQITAQEQGLSGWRERKPDSSQALLSLESLWWTVWDRLTGWSSNDPQSSLHALASSYPFLGFLIAVRVALKLILCAEPVPPQPALPQGEWWGNTEAPQPGCLRAQLFYVRHFVRLPSGNEITSFWGLFKYFFFYEMMRRADF